jgi:hypothetical protein
VVLHWLRLMGLLMLLLLLLLVIWIFMAICYRCNSIILMIVSEINVSCWSLRMIVLISSTVENLFNKFNIYLNFSSIS